MQFRSYVRDHVEAIANGRAALLAPAVANIMANIQQRLLRLTILTCSGSRRLKKRWVVVAVHSMQSLNQNGAHSQASRMQVHRGSTSPRSTLRHARERRLACLCSKRAEAVGWACTDVEQRALQLELLGFSNSSSESRKIPDWISVRENLPDVLFL
jgi:hypothetical protein